MGVTETSSPAGEGVAVGVEEGVGVAVGPEAPESSMSRCTLFEAASSELKVKPSLLAVSRASEKSAPALDATAEVTSTSVQVERTVPGVNVVIAAPFGRALP